MTTTPENTTSGFENRVVVITGASRGIGRATAMTLAAKKARVVINARDASVLEEVAAEVRASGGEAVAVHGDITDDDTPTRLLDMATDRFGRVDHIVSNVGFSASYGPLMSLEKSAFAKTMLANTWTTIRLLQEAVRHGLGSHDGASAVIVSTVGAQQVQPLAGPYTAAKAALEVLAKVLAHELCNHPIRVNTVAPGLVRSRTSEIVWAKDNGAAEERLVPLGRLGFPQDVADAIAFLLSAQAAWITGSTLLLDGGRSLVGDESADQLQSLTLHGFDRQSSKERS